MSVTDQTLDLIRKAMADPKQMDALAKAFTTGTGLVWYDLEAGAKQLYPVITPLRNQIARVKGNGGTATHWKAITGINITGLALGVSEGSRGGVVTTEEQDNVATYASLGLEDYVTFEADLAAENFDDVKALAVEGLLRAVMIGEEKLIIGGNHSLALGTTPTPTLTGLSTGGTLTGAASPGTTYSIICAALSLDGYMNGSVAGGIPGAVSRANADGSTDVYGGGSAKPSASATVALTGTTTGSIQASVAPVRGAVAYAWFWGAAGSEVLGAITTINSVLITAAASGTQAGSSLTQDNSTNDLVFDGLISQIATLGSNAYFAAQATGTPGTGTPLTADGAGGIAEIDAAFKSFWDNYRLGPDEMLVSSQEVLNITKKVIAGGGAPLFRFVMNAENGASPSLTAGAVVGTYLNKFTMSGGNLVKVRLHPNVPAGTILFYSRELPYPLSNVRNALQIKTRREYYEIEWPRTTRRYEYGVYVDEVLQNYFPPAFGMITNVANG